MQPNRLKIIVADDNKDFRDILCEFLQNDFDVVGVANNGVEAVSMITSKQPDLVILDIIMPLLDGIGVLEKINSLSLKKKPQFVMLSAVGQDKIIHKVLSLGAVYYVVKPFDFYVLMSRLRQLQTPSSNFTSDNPDNFYTFSENKFISNNIEVKITNILNEIGVPAHLKGYQYLRKAIMMVVENFDVIHSLTKIIYPTIASEYNSTSTRIERAMRNAINVTWSRENIDRLNSVLEYTVTNMKGNPTNSHFIALIADKLRLELKS